MMELKYKKTILFFIIIILFFASIYFYKLERSWVFKLKYYYGFKEISKISTIGSFGDGYIINKFSFNEESFSRLKQDLDMKSMTVMIHFCINSWTVNFPLIMTQSMSAVKLKKYLMDCMYLIILLLIIQ